MTPKEEITNAARLWRDAEKYLKESKEKYELEHLRSGEMNDELLLFKEKVEIQKRVVVCCAGELRVKTEAVVRAAEQ